MSPGAMRRRCWWPTATRRAARTSRGLGGPEQEQLRRLAEVLLLKRGPTRKAMLDEITLFLKHTLSTHRAAGHERAAPPEIQQGLANRKVLIVDDDVRNVFALTGALE